MSTEVDLRAISARVATEIMGVPMPPKGEAPHIHQSITTHKSGLWYWHHGEESWIPMPFSESIECAFQMEERIKELGLTGRYVMALKEIVIADASKVDKFVTTFDLIHASSLDRCAAALAVRANQTK